MKIDQYNYEQLRVLTARVDLPIAGRELNIGLHQVRQLVEHDCCDLIQATAAFFERGSRPWEESGWNSRSIRR